MVKGDEVVGAAMATARRGVQPTALNAGQEGKKFVIVPSIHTTRRRRRCMTKKGVCGVGCPMEVHVVSDEVFVAPYDQDRCMWCRMSRGCM
jgi:hypothetical protein